MSTITCSSCSRQYAATFPRCVFCNTPRGAAPPENASPPTAAPMQAPAAVPPPARPPGPTKRQVEELLTKAVRRHAKRDIEGRIAKYLVKLGGCLMVFGAMMVACNSALSTDVSKVAPSDLAKKGRGGRVLVDGRANMGARVQIDANESIEIEDVTQLITQQRQLLGRNVEIDAVCESALTWVTTRTRNGQTEQVDRDSRVFCPVFGSNSRVWVLSEPVDVQGANDSRVAEFAARGTYDGKLVRLRRVTDLQKFRNASVSGAGPAANKKAPDDALAVVSNTGGHQEDVVTLAPLVGTNGAVWLVAEREQLFNESPIYGRYHPCPSKQCAQFAMHLEEEPQGFLEISPTRPPKGDSPLKSGGTLFLGALLLGLGVTTRRWYPKIAGSKEN